MGRIRAVSPRLDIQPSVILWLSVLAYLHLSVVGPFLLSALLHELGHGLALCRLKKPPFRVALSFSGAVMETPPLSYREEFLAALAGPAVSLLLGLALPLWPELGFYSLALGLFNLLPICGLDGGRMLRSALLLHLPEPAAQRIFRLTGIVTASLLFLSGVLLSAHLHLGLWPMALTGLLLYKALTTGPL